MVNWQEIRNFFPAAKNYTYLNAAGGSPVSKQAADAARAFYNEIEQEGDTLYDDWMEKTEVVRKQLADFIHADPRETGFTLNTSHGMNIIANMHENTAEMLTMEDEFPSSTLPWINKNFSVRFIPSQNNQYPIEHIEKHITAKTKILVSSYVQYNTGFRQDIEALGKLCRKHNLTFVLNATQAMGVLPIDIKKIQADYMVFTGLKWPMAGYGIGGLFIRKGLLKKMRYPVAGWQSVAEPEHMDNKNMYLKEAASVFEMGCPHFPNIFALGAALNLLKQIGQENIYNRIMYLSDYFEKAMDKTRIPILSTREKKHRSGITLIGCPDPDQMVKKLLEKGIIVSKRGSGIRVALHIYNNEADIDKFAEAFN